FAQGNDTMERQVALVQGLLKERTEKNIPWLIGGDFNLLSPGSAYYDIIPTQRVYFKERSELEPLFKEYQSVPSLADIYGKDAKKWITHFPNDPEVKAPDRTIDYIFASPLLTVSEKHIRQQDTLKISDHFPVVAVFRLPK
ncbi:MAG: endonuclease/exonuclease/phosphatase family protein, partial [Spirochaetota bacterium]